LPIFAKGKNAAKKRREGEPKKEAPSGFLQTHKRERGKAGAFI